MSRIAEGFEYGPYGDLPGHKESTTSKDAALTIARTAVNLRALVLAALEAAGPRGLTSDEVAARLNQSVLSIRPRISELGPGRLNLIERTGERRWNFSGLKAACWKVRKTTL